MIDFLNSIVEWFTSGIYEFFADVFAWLLIKMTLATISFKVVMIKFFMTTGMAILEQLSISTILSQFIGELNSDALNAMNFFRIFDAMNIILTSYITKYLMKQVGM